MDKVKKYIDANKDRFISELFDLLRIPSISAQSEHRPDMTRCAEWLAAALVKAGADHAEVFPTEGNPVVYAEKTVDPKAKTVLVYVSAGNPVGTRLSLFSSTRSNPLAFRIAAAISAPLSVISSRTLRSTTGSGQ